MYRCEVWSARVKVTVTVRIIEDGPGPDDSSTCSNLLQVSSFIEILPYPASLNQLSWCQKIILQVSPVHYHRYRDLIVTGGSGTYLTWLA
jgi:hypothetical protein